MKDQDTERLINYLFAKFTQSGFVEKIVDNTIEVDYKKKYAIVSEIFSEIINNIAKQENVTKEDFDNKLFEAIAEKIIEYINTNDDFQTMKFKNTNIKDYVYGLNEAELKKADIEDIVKTILKKEHDKNEIIGKKEIRDMIRKMIVKQYKVFWEKSAFYINQI